MLGHFHVLFPPSYALPLDNLCNGKFHKHLQDLYAPLVVRYVDLMESSIAQSIHRGFERESWEPVKDLHWPEEEFGKHLETRLKLMSSDMIESCVKRLCRDNTIPKLTISLKRR
ncbi:hypothetical protein FQN60_009320 [Etheostoma spectabile]|uniref:MHD1 domain-containing protein n=1 Tax=Etheostoma spectabile TaxID=54343 RepID=A0A5J5DIK1_9PERO|nr:hypothetical protein FQN60_009320 [Etheostoma spectabile]